MHHIYTTKAFVIHSTPHGEAGKFLLLFTQDFGMVGAVATGIRLEKSKLKSHLQDFDYTMVSLVKGKEVWRVTGAHELAHEKITGLHLRILKLLRRLLHGEEKNEKLFKIIEELYTTEIVEREVEMKECLTVLQILHTLGYVAEKDMDETVKKDKKKIIAIINQSLKESHL